MTKNWNCHIKIEFLIDFLSYSIFLAIKNYLSFASGKVPSELYDIILYA